MEIINLSSFTVAYLPGRINFPGHSLTLIVKGTFDLKPDGTAVESPKQLFPTGDEFYPEDEEMIGGPKYSSDFAYIKPRADLLLVGKFYSPQGRKVYSSFAKFQVGSKSKTLSITGNRYWTGGLSSNTYTNPESFSEMELRYEKSFGGVRYVKNPVGKGIDKPQNEKFIPIPNILHQNEHFLSPNAKLEPAGFGPLGQTWIQRASKLGSYKGNYMQERWPWFAKDFDWGYFNSAPHDMQLSGYLSGNEKLYFENLHPVHSQYHSQLPGLRVKCFAKISEENNQNIFKEVAMNPDTLWTDMENEKVVLVWRGFLEIKNEDFDELKNILIVSESLNEQSRTAEYYRGLLETTLVQYEEEFTPQEPVESKEDADLELEKELAEADAQIKASLIEAGIDPDNPVISEEDKNKEAEILKQLGIDEGTKDAPWTRRKVIETANKKQNFNGEDLRGIDLAETNLSGLQFKNCIFANISLKNADLSNSDFTGAVFSGTDLSGANLKFTVLKEADLTGAKLENADLTGAVIDNAVFEGSDLRNALLHNVKGKDAYFSQADLTGAVLAESQLPGADFSKSILNNADLKNCLLQEVSAEGASGILADFSGADITGFRASGKSNFSQASFQKIHGPDSIWEHADLTGTDFSFSQMEAANFSSAVLKKAKLNASNLKFARFIKADLENASLTKINLFQGSLEKANLTGTDLSGSNLYGVEFLDSTRRSVKLFSANLKMTKLETAKS